MNRFMASMLLAAAFVQCLPVAGAQTLRERIRERIEERRAQASSPVAAPESRNPPSAPDTHEYRLDHDGLPRRYLIHVPAGLDPARPAPLVLALHGGGGHAEYMADDQRYGLIGEADRRGFVVVFPNGYSRFPGGRLATWNAGGCCGDARDRNIDDVGFLRAVVDDVRKQVRIDPARVFATGMSNGAMMSYRLACEAADLFRGIAAVAGTEAAVRCQPDRAVAILHVHARDDTHVLFEGGAGPDAFRDPGKVMAFVAVPETVSRWVGRNRCATSPRRVLEVTGAYCERYADCRSASPVQLCVTENGGHSWPGAHVVRRGKEAASQALDANATISEFFASLPPR